MPRDSHFERFEPHTQLKHFLLDVYLKAWATILLPPFRRVWFVDAFAGEGQDDEGRPGSPVIACRVAEELNEKHFPAGIRANTGMRVLAIEADHERFQLLRDVLHPYASPARQWPSTVAFVLEGRLEQRVGEVTKRLKDSPTLYFLDPFGIDGLSASVLPDLLDGPQKELLLLFSDEGAVRLAGKARAGVPDELEAIAAAEAEVEPSLFGEEETERARREARQAAKRRVAGHKSNPKAEAIMDRAFGGDWWRPIIEATPEDRRQAKFVELYCELLERNGATKRLTFSIDTVDGRHKYFLIHASKDRRAFTTMKDKMHRTRNKARERTTHEAQLFQTFETENVIPAIADTIAAEFEGREVRWTGVPGAVQAFALEETPLWRHEFEALQLEMLRRGYTQLNEKGKPRSPLTFLFPPESN